MKRVAIIGGGISGTATAYYLARQTREGQPTDFVLFESSPRLGGIVETVHRDGFVIECGPDSWVTEKPWARELAAELGLDAEIIESNDVDRCTYILRNGQLIPMPDGMRMMVPTDLEALSQSLLFSPAAIADYLAEPNRAEELKAASPEKDESVASFVRRHFGEEASNTIAGPLLAGVFGGSIEQLSVRAVMPAFVRMEKEHGSLIRALQSKTPSRSASSIFTTLRPGLQTLIDTMAKTLPATSVRVRQPVVAFSRGAHSWFVTTPVGSEEFDSVVLACPIHVARQLLVPISSHFDEALKMDATSAIVVAFAFQPGKAESMKIPPGFGFLVPPSSSTANDPRLLACTFVNQKFADRTPLGGILLRAFFGGDAGAALLAEPDSAILSMARHQLARVLGRLPEPDISLVRRWPRSLPQYTVGHLDRVKQLEAQLGSFPGLHLTGNAYHGVGLPDLIRDGLAIAWRLSTRR
jgi:protoporphyrinogen/coproporphyrinogen III oxidase